VIVFIVPKNSGLEICRKISDNFTGEVIKSRGEDVPCFVARMVDQGKKVIGITGEDLFAEFLLNNKDSGIEVIETIPWVDDNTMFGKPALCLLGPKDVEMKDLPKKLRICINKKYKMISDEFLAKMKYNERVEFEKIYLSGSTEETFMEGISDLVIDIVYSGKSIEEAGLKVYEKIFESDVVVIGKKNDILDNLDWDKMGGLIPTILKDEQGNILTLVYSNKESFARTRVENKPYFYSRSRKKVCFKGSTSGNTQKLIDVKTDCDGDALVFTVRQKNNACHLGGYSCFGEERRFDMRRLYDKIVERMNSEDESSYTKKLKDNPDFLRRKLVEEAAEVITENPDNKEKLVGEFADLFYNILVYMAVNGIDVGDIEEENFRRDK